MGNRLGADKPSNNFKQTRTPCEKISAGGFGERSTDINRWVNWAYNGRADTHRAGHTGDVFYSPVSILNTLYTGPQNIPTGLTEQRRNGVNIRTCNGGWSGGAMAGGDECPAGKVCQCQDFWVGEDYCSRWCNTPGKWGCGIGTSNNDMAGVYTCDCAGCNGCPGTPAIPLCKTNCTITADGCVGPKCPSNCVPYGHRGCTAVWPQTCHTTGMYFTENERAPACYRLATISGSGYHNSNECFDDLGVLGGGKHRSSTTTCQKAGLTCYFSHGLFTDSDPQWCDCTLMPNGEKNWQCYSRADVGWFGGSGGKS